MPTQSVFVSRNPAAAPAPLATASFGGEAEARASGDPAGGGSDDIAGAAGRGWREIAVAGTLGEDGEFRVQLSRERERPPGLGYEIGRAHV